MAGRRKWAMSGFLVVLALGVAAVARAQSPTEEAVRLIGAYHEDPTRLERARDLLERALTNSAPPELLATLARVYFLIGDVRAASTDEKLAAYDRGRELGRRAVELAPKGEDAHFWYAANTGRFGQTKGIMRSLVLLPTMRGEVDTLLAINAGSPRVQGVAANFFAEVPGLLGGDRARAEAHWKKGIDIDPRYTVLHVDYAKFLIGAGRADDARRELQRVIDETAPTNRADWTMRDLPRARMLLESLKGK